MQQKLTNFDLKQKISGCTTGTCKIYSPFFQLETYKQALAVCLFFAMAMGGGILSDINFLAKCRVALVMGL